MADPILLNNNQVSDLIQDAIEMATGKTEGTTLDLQGVIDTGNDGTIIASVEQFTKALITTVTKFMFTDEAYTAKYKSPFFVNEDEFAGITELISMELPTAQDSHAWKNFVSGTTTAGEYTLFLPVIDNQFFGKTNSFEIPIAITGEQWDSAVRDEAGKRKLVNYIMLVVQNAVTLHIEQLDKLNRNNWIAEKIAYAASDDAAGIHVVDFTKAWAEFTGATEDISREDMLNNPDALRWISGQLDLYAGYLQEMSSLFTTNQSEKFVPAQRLEVEVLKAFATQMRTAVYSTTYNPDYVQLPGYQEVSAWQFMNGLEFDSVSGINIETGSAGDSVEADGIIGIMCDQYAIMHTLIKRRVAVTKFDPEDVTQYYHQFRDGLYNNLTLPGIVFVINDWEAPSEDEDDET